MNLALHIHGDLYTLGFADTKIRWAAALEPGSQSELKEHVIAQVYATDDPDDAQPFWYYDLAIADRKAYLLVNTNRVSPVDSISARGYLQERAPGGILNKTISSIYSGAVHIEEGTTEATSLGTRMRARNYARSEEESC